MRIDRGIACVLRVRTYLQLAGQSACVGAAVGRYSVV